MTEADIRKLLKLMETHQVIFKQNKKIWEVFPNNEKSVHVLTPLGGCGIIDLQDLSAEDFYVTIPLTQVKQGLQPQ